MESRLAGGAVAGRHEHGACRTQLLQVVANVVGDQEPGWSGLPTSQYSAMDFYVLCPFITVINGYFSYQIRRTYGASFKKVLESKLAGFMPKVYMHPKVITFTTTCQQGVKGPKHALGSWVLKEHPAMCKKGSCGNSHP